MRKTKEQNSKHKIPNTSNGITLIALVITIIVMLILVAVTISMAVDGGLFDFAKRATTETENAIDVEQQLANGQIEIDGTIYSSIDEYIQKLSGTGITIEEAMSTDGPLSTTRNTKVIDNLGNSFIVPAGFKIVKNNVSNVTYTYEEDANGNPTGTPSVQDGIVIEDATQHNQFVWIPVGEIINRDTTTSAMPLARYEALRSEEDWSLTIINKAQEATTLLTDKNSTVDIKNESNYYLIFHELVKKATSSDGVPSNQVANNLIEFINSAINNRGFYIARYEAGVETFDETKTQDSLAEMEEYREDISYDSSLIDYSYSANWTAYKTSNNSTPKVVSKPGYQVWNYITQIKAAEVSRNMYSNSTKFVSDLANSFAWDTAVMFLTTYSGNNNYALGNYGPDDELKQSGELIDVYCNLFDLSGNYAEWSTENYLETDYGNNEGEYVGSSVLRGGCYIPDYEPVNFSLSRNVSPIDSCNYGITFRPIIYIK